MQTDADAQKFSLKPLAAAFKGDKWHYCKRNARRVIEKMERKQVELIKKTKRITELNEEAVEKGREPSKKLQQEGLTAKKEKENLDEEIITIEELLTALDGNLIDPQSAMIAATLSP